MLLTCYTMRLIPCGKLLRVQPRLNRFIRYLIKIMKTSKTLEYLIRCNLAEREEKLIWWKIKWIWFRTRYLTLHQSSDETFINLRAPTNYRNEPKWTEMNRNELKWTEMNRNEPKWNRNETKWILLITPTDSNGPQRTPTVIQVIRP